MGFQSFHSVPAPPGHLVLFECHLLVWVPIPDGFSTSYVVPHMLTQCLSQLLASAPWWSAAPRTFQLIFQKHSLLPSCPWISCHWLFSLLWSVVLCCMDLTSQSIRTKCNILTYISSINTWALVKEESPEAQVLIELIYVRILQKALSPIESSVDPALQVPLVLVVVVQRCHSQFFVLVCYG